MHIFNFAKCKIQSFLISWSIDAFIAAAPAATTKVRLKKPFSMNLWANHKCWSSRKASILATKRLISLTRNLDHRKVVTSRKRPSIYSISIKLWWLSCISIRSPLNRDLMNQTIEGICHARAIKNSANKEKKEKTEKKRWTSRFVSRAAKTKCIVTWKL